ncbi:MAG: DUF423 domain-containing protein [Flavobacteriaceae bacterium]|jgi:uncharacterized membrane protein YgdD (TMEM256/DUF423 family)|nr:DUF423 domain-containing protein [Flavobacteriaceae bacterium]
MKYKLLQIWGVLFCGSAVVLGAFGAHLLSDLLSSDALQSFEVGVRYQFFHGLALLYLSLSQDSKKGMTTTALFFTVGTLLFSISIYLLSLSTMYGDTGLPAILGPVTPIGGLLLILGWVNLLVGYVRT